MITGRTNWNKAPFTENNWQPILDIHLSNRWLFIRTEKMSEQFAFPVFVEAGSIEFNAFIERLRE